MIFWTSTLPALSACRIYIPLAIPDASQVNEYGVTLACRTPSCKLATSWPVILYTLTDTKPSTGIANSTEVVGLNGFGYAFPKPNSFYTVN